MRSVPIHLAVAESPRVTALRVEPDYALGALANLAQAPVMRQIVVVTSIAKDNHRGSLVDGADMVTDEVAEGSAEIRMGIDVDDIAFKRYVECFFYIVGAKALGNLTDIGDEHVAAHA